MYLELFQNILWGWHVLLVILVTGMGFTLRTSFFQIKHMFFWLKTAVIGSKKEKRKGEPQGVSQFQALTAALAGSIGTGNIVGVAAAITVGGPGAIFWMWVSALFGMMTVFAENYLSAKYREAPGAFGYISKVKKAGKVLAIIYAAGCFLSSLGMGNMVQVNAAAAAFSEFGIPIYISAAVMAAVLFIVAKGGLKSAVKITEKLVPFMTVVFFAAAIGVIFVFRDNLPSAFSSIFEGAFSLKAGVGGTAGMLIAAKTGISRGVFTNEAGLGSSAFAYDDVRDRTPLELGCMGIFQVFIDTILMCTVTALCILAAPKSGFSGAELTFFAFESALGDMGSKAVSLCTALFAFATTVTWCCYGREGLFYMIKGKGKNTFAVLYAAAAFLGCVVPLDIAFKIGDAFNGLMAIPNILALIYFSREITTDKLKRDFNRKPKVYQCAHKSSPSTRTRTRISYRR